MQSHSRVVDAVFGGGAAALVQFLRSDSLLARGYRVIFELSCAGRILRKNRLCVSSLSVFACVFFGSFWTVQMNVMNREACFGCPLHVIAESNRDPSSRYYVWFDYLSRNRSENVCRNDIFDFAAYCFEKGHSTLLKSAHPPALRCLRLFAVGVFRHRESSFM